MDREPNHNTTTTALDHAVTIPALTYPSTSATYTVEYSIQYVNPRMVGILSTQRRAVGASGKPQCNLQTWYHDITGALC